MIQFISKNRTYIYVVLLTLIILSNYLLYNMTSMQPVPKGAVLGSLLDFFIVIPILTYLFIIRKKYSLKYLGLVVLAGYGAAYFIIPNQHLSAYPFLPYIILISEGALILVELYILFKIVRVLPAIVREYKSIKEKNSYFLYNVKRSVENHFPNNRLVYVFLSELSTFYYSLFCWRKKLHVPNGQYFSYHKKTSVIAVYIMLIHATVLESVGLHYLLHQWNEVVAYILLFLNIYAVLYFIAEIQATRLSPFLLTDKTLYLQVGISSSMNLPFDQIKELKHYDGPEKLPKHERKTVFDARVSDFFQEKPMFEIKLKRKEKLRLMYGISREVDRILLDVDDSQEFFNEMQKRIIAQK